MADASEKREAGPFAGQEPAKPDPPGYFPGESMTRRRAFTVAGQALGGVAGTLYALSVNSVAVGMDQQVELRGLAIIVLGGMGSVPGAVVGGFAMALVAVFGGSVVGAPYRDAMAFVVLFLVLVLRPGGIFGRHSLWAT